VCFKSAMASTISFKNGLIVATFMFISCGALREDVEVGLETENEAENPDCKPIKARSICPNIDENDAGFGILERIAGLSKKDLTCLHFFVTNDGKGKLKEEAKAHCAAAWEAVKTAMRQRDADSRIKGNFEKMLEVVNAGITAEGGELIKPEELGMKSQEINIYDEDKTEKDSQPFGNALANAKVEGKENSTGEVKKDECWCRSGVGTSVSWGPYPKSSSTFNGLCLNYKSCSECTRFSHDGKPLACCESIINKDGSTSKGTKCSNPKGHDFGGKQCNCRGTITFQETINKETGTCPPTKKCTECTWRGFDCSEYSAQ